MKNFIFVLLIIFISASTTLSQYVPSGERGDTEYRINSQLEANRIRTTVHNFGFLGRTGGNFPIEEQTPFEWPKNSGQVYMALNAIFIGAEVVDDNGDSIHIVEVPAFRNAPDGTSWNFEPVPGYYNTERNEIASSEKPDTWPESWPDKMSDVSDPGWSGSWNGYLGKNRFINGEELYYRFSDDKYSRYPFYAPDSTDPSRKGLGLIVSARLMSFTDTPFEDLVYAIYTIKNDGTKPLSKMALTIWAADFVGGNGDSHDDMIGYNISKNLVWFYDKDNSSPSFGDDPVGSVGIAIIETPELDNGIKTSKIFNVQYDPAGEINFNSITDDELWQKYMSPDKYVDPTTIETGEYDGFISSGYFALEPGETAEFVFAVIFSNGPKSDPDNSYRISELERKAEYAEEFFNSGFKQNAFIVSIAQPNYSDILNGTANIAWEYGDAAGGVKSIVFNSTDMGTTWKFLGSSEPGEQYFSWDTKNSPNGILNKVSVYTFAENGVSGGISDRFTIFNPENESTPQIYIETPGANEELNGDYTVKWISGCADETIDATSALYYRTFSGVEWTELIGGKSENEFVWETNQFPNSDFYELLGEIVWDGGSDSVIISPFKIFNEHPTPADSLIDIVRETNGTGLFEIHIVNGAEITGHSYSVTFMKPTCLDCDALFYSVVDDFDGIEKAVGIVSEDSSIEGPYFDGLSLVIVNDSLKLDTSESGWNNGDVYDYVFEVLKAHNEEGTPFPNNYEIVFDDDVGFGVSKEFTLSGVTYPSTPVNFKVKNTDDDKWIDFGFIEIDFTGGEGKFTANGAARDRIVFLENSNKDEQFTYWVYLSTDFGYRFPAGGDTLSIFQFKPFEIGDKIYFTTANITGIENEFENPGEFKLFQNYPNPFNPTTKIVFNVPKTSFVELKIYDILGREIKTLIKGEFSAGKYETDFNAKNLASGIYFYRLKSGDFSVTKKMVLLR